MSQIRVLVVDDSATMRGLITACLRRDPAIEVVGQAAEPLQARKAIKDLDPDVVTLDVEMPNMSGVDFLEKIMRLRPTPVVMVSSLTQRGADVTLQALEIGAVDCVGKPSVADSTEAFGAELVAKVKAAARARVRARADRKTPEVRGDFRGNGALIAIGASTGGVEALITMLSAFPANCPATVITQHMPETFTRSFAERLNRMSQPTVQVAFEGAPLAPGHVYVAPGGSSHLEVLGSPGVCRLSDRPPVNGHRPSVDVMFHSVAQAAGAAAVGVILTGMGRDGADGLLAMRRAGAQTFGQDEASCVVYGMPKAAAESGAVVRQGSPASLAAFVLDTCDTRARVS